MAVQALAPAPPAAPGLVPAPALALAPALVMAPAPVMAPVGRREEELPRQSFLPPGPAGVFNAAEVAPLRTPDVLDAEGVQQRDAHGVGCSAAPRVRRRQWRLHSSLEILFMTSAFVRPTIPRFPSSSDRLASVRRRASSESTSKMQ